MLRPLPDILPKAPALQILLPWAWTNPPFGFRKFSDTGRPQDRRPAPSSPPAVSHTSAAQSSRRRPQRSGNRLLPPKVRCCARCRLHRFFDGQPAPAHPFLHIHRRYVHFHPLNRHPSKGLRDFDRSKKESNPPLWADIPGYCKPSQ